jgi:pyruvate kinase
LAIALDTKGPEIRTGNTIDDADIPIAAGHEMIITTDEQCIYRSTKNSDCRL